MFVKCDIVKKHNNGEYYSCSECKHRYAEELDNYAMECDLLYHSFYNWEYEDEMDENGEYIEKICVDFVEQ